MSVGTVLVPYRLLPMGSSCPMPVSQRGVGAPRSGDVSPDEGEAEDSPRVEARSALPWPGIKWGKQRLAVA